MVVSRNRFSAAASMDEEVDAPWSLPMPSECESPGIPPRFVAEESPAMPVPVPSGFSATSGPFELTKMIDSGIGYSSPDEGEEAEHPWGLPMPRTAPAPRPLAESYSTPAFPPPYKD
jgi:hypothetical protein